MYCLNATYPEEKHADNWHHVHCSWLTWEKNKKKTNSVWKYNNRNATYLFHKCKYEYGDVSVMFCRCRTECVFKFMLWLKMQSRVPYVFWIFSFFCVFIRGEKKQLLHIDYFLKIIHPLSSHHFVTTPHCEICRTATGHNNLPFWFWNNTTTYRRYELVHTANDHRDEECRSLKVSIKTDRLLSV